MSRFAVIAALALVCDAVVLAGQTAAQPGSPPPMNDGDGSPRPLPPPPLPPVPEEAGFVGGGFIVGADQFLDAALAVEAAFKLGSLPLWVRGLGAMGKSFDFEGGG